jgi:hypothetical protein
MLTVVCSALKPTPSNERFRTPTAILYTTRAAQPLSVWNPPALPNRIGPETAKYAEFKDPTADRIANER